MYSHLFEYAIYPLHEAINGRSTLAELRNLEKHQLLDATTRAGSVSTRLAEFLHFASANVPHYRELLAGQRLDTNSLYDFSRLPFLDRHFLQTAFSSLRNPHYAKKVRIQSTGGSSGTPVRFCTDAVRDSRTIAMRLRAQRRFGVNIGDKEVVVWGSPIELGRQDFPRRVRDFVFRSKLIYAFNFSEEKMRSAIQTILSFKPRKIYGYAQSIHMLAKFYLDHYPPRGQNKLCDVVFTTAEPLFDYQHAEIQEAFGAKIAVEYGARDAGLIAHECPEGRMHINAEGIYVEIIDENGNVLPPGKTGEIVVTNFDTPSMPIIRYRTGDMGMLLDETCPCGVTLPLMKVVGGRMSDFLVGADGRRIHPLGGIYILREIEPIRCFRIIQNEVDHLELHISAASKLDEQTLQNIRKKFDCLLGSPVQLSVKYMDEIESSSASGKFRHVICNVRA